MDLDVFFILDALIVLRFYCYLNAIEDRPSVSVLFYEREKVAA